MLNAQNIKLAHGKRAILDDISLSLLAKDRVALVGENGAGKSSLLSVLAGEPADHGSVEKAKDLRIGFLKQVPELDESVTVLGAVETAISHQLADIAEHQRLCVELAATAEDKMREQLLRRIDLLAHRIESNGGFDVQHWVEKVLSRLGIKARTQKIGTLSGGERRRVDLARILLMAPDIYLLDEPTNHLDIKAIQFLVETFSRVKASVLFVSHDSAFIDELATRIVELSNGKLYAHEPPFANYVENKAVRELIESRTLHRRERLLVGELVWLRAGTPARTTKQNARIDRAYDLMEQIAKDKDLQQKKRLELEMSTSRRLGHTILEFDHVGMAHGSRILFKDLNLKVVARQRYGILGLNGCGKTTLLSVIAQKLRPSFGELRFGKNTVVIEFDQQREKLEASKTLKETLADHGDYVRLNEENIHIASYLERYLFSPNDANRRVDTLSGGEQNRLLLAKLLRISANCLLLDEPTNDLDMTSLLVLEETLLDYDGVIFVVSHDRRFLDRVCTNILAFEQPTSARDGESVIAIYPGNYSDYLRLKARQSNLDVKSSLKAESVTEKLRPERRKTKRSFKEEREFQEMGSVIERLEEERAALFAEIAEGQVFRKDGAEVQLKLERLAELDVEIEKLYSRWQELMDIGSVAGGGAS